MPSPRQIAPSAGQDTAVKLSSCFVPMSGGWYVIPGTLMIACSKSMLWP